MSALQPVLPILQDASSASSGHNLETQLSPAAIGRLLQQLLVYLLALRIVQQPAAQQLWPRGSAVRLTSIGSTVLSPRARMPGKGCACRVGSSRAGALGSAGTAKHGPERQC